MNFAIRMASNFEYFEIKTFNTLVELTTYIKNLNHPVIINPLPWYQPSRELVDKFLEDHPDCKITGKIENSILIYDDYIE